MTFNYAYFPGCSQVSSAEEYGLSTMAVCKSLGIELTELEDWNCCGASSAHMTNDFISVGLPARNLALAEQTGLDLLTVCAACYSRLKAASARLKADISLREGISEVIDADPLFRGRIRHLLDVIVNDVGISEIKRHVRRDLSGIKAVPYYGCLLVRPREVCFCDSSENPTDLDRLISALGLEVRKWSYKTDCCGGSLSLSRNDIVQKLVNRIFEQASQAGADLIVTACPMCQANLEMRQSPGKLRFKLLYRIPVVYFTEILGVAMELEGWQEWLGAHLISPAPILERTNSGGVV